ncbi:putative DNA-binding protein ribbon-helix-helix domain-containing protein, partial [Dysosmobacter welbionis]
PLGIGIGDVDHIIDAALGAVAALRQYAHYHVGHAADGNRLTQRIRPESVFRQIGTD